MKLEVQIIKELPAFNINVSFECKSGELLALVGPSGAGKTTLMRIVAGLEKPDLGRIVFNGDTWIDSKKKIDLAPQKRGLGYVFQEYTLFPHLTVSKNVAFANRDRIKVAEILKRLDIWHLRHRKPHKLSGGERQRVALAQALAKEPKVLLLDEPFSALDILTRRKLRHELMEIKQEFKLPIIHVTHDLDEAEYLADALLPIVQGEVDKRWLETQPGKNFKKASGPQRLNNKIVPIYNIAEAKIAGGITR